MELGPWQIRYQGRVYRSDQMLNATASKACHTAGVDGRTLHPARHPDDFVACLAALVEQEDGDDFARMFARAAALTWAEALTMVEPLGA